MNDKVYSVQDVARMLNADRSTVYAWIIKGRLKVLITNEKGKKYVIPEEYFNEFVTSREKESSGYSVTDISKKLDVCEETVRRWIKSGKLKAILNYRRDGYLVTEKDLNKFITNRKEELSGYSVMDISKEFDVDDETVRLWIRSGKLKASRVGNLKKYIISKDDLNEFIDRHIGTGYDAITVGKMFNVSNEAVRIWIRSGKLKASRVGKRKKYMISKDDLNEFIDNKIK